MLTTCFVDGIKTSIEEYQKDSTKTPYCPLGHRLIAKKGKIVVHHFAHHPGEKCDSFRKGMTNFHAQWQRIVLDKNNLEVCLDKDGNRIVLNKTSKGKEEEKQNIELINILVNIPDSVKKQNTFEQNHIADIINPDNEMNGRPLVIEVQHSPMNKETIDKREQYYQNMVWLFDLTPRVVRNGNHNKIVFVDGKIVFLKEVTNYVAVINAESSIFQEVGPNHREGIFIITQTRTKYWYETTKPTYFDCGFGILYLIRKLDKGFCLTKYLTYGVFFTEVMPPLNKDKVEKCQWFYNIEFNDLIKLNMLPVPIKTSPIEVTKERVTIFYKGPELDCIGMKQNKHGWYFDPFMIQTETNILQTLVMDAKTGNFNNDINSDDTLLFMKLRKYLGVTNNVPIDTYKYGGDVFIRIICTKETFRCKSKFKALEMQYRKGKKNTQKETEKSRWIVKFKGFDKKLNEVM